MLFLAFILNGVMVHGAVFGYDFRMWQVSLFVIFLILLLDKSLLITKKMLVVLTLLVMHSLTVTFANGVLPWFTIVQIVLVFFTLIVSFSLVKSIGVDCVLKIYFKAALLLASAVIFEEIVYLLFSYNIRSAGFVGPFIRASGVVTEPSQVAVLVAPALLYGLVWKQRFSSLLLFVAVIFSFSSLSYIATLIVFLLYFMFLVRSGRKSKGKTIALSMILALMIVGVALAPNVHERLQQLSFAVNLLGNKTAELSDYRAAAGTAATLIFNTNVAIISMENTYGLGVGFGSFRVAFSKYASDMIDLEKVNGLFYNRASGGNLLIRSMAELGIIGVLALLLLLLCGFVNYCKFISNGCLPVGTKKRLCVSSGMFLVVFVVFLLRKDMWFSFYLMLFVSLYIVDSSYYRYFS